MSKKGKKKSAESLEAQARAHEALYGSDSREVDEYRMQAMRISEKHGINLNGEKIDAKELKILNKRLDEFTEGKRKMEGELTFFKVLKSVEMGEAINLSNEDEERSYHMLELLGYIKDEKLSGKGREFLKKMEK